MKIVVNGIDSVGAIPGLAQAVNEFDIVVAPDQEQLVKALPGAEVLVGWNFQSRDMQGQWGAADSLRWIHWCGASVDRIMSPELTSSKIVLTNARGIFDLVMAEYILCYMLSEAKNFRETIDLQRKRLWKTRVTGRLAGSTAVIFGVGSIGRTTARLLSAVGVKVLGVGRTARQNDPDFDRVVASEQSRKILKQADWVIGLMPLTAETRDYFDQGFFSKMKTGARFINLGRGESVEEAALVEALKEGKIAGAMLDVFQREPLDDQSPLWEAPNVIVSPHTSSYYAEYEEDMAAQFLENLKRFSRGDKLVNQVDTSLGFVPSEN